MEVKTEPFALYWLSEKQTEDVMHYRSGGYHPIVIGNVLVGQVGSYRIVHKLGFGSRATVWLGQNLDSQLFVSIKITNSAVYVCGGEEGKIVMAAGNHPNIVDIYDSFAVDGPNGTHFVLVSEVVVPVAALGRLRSPTWFKSVLHGVVAGVAHLHAQHIVHGAVCSRHVGISIPPLDQSSVWETTEFPDVTPVLPKSSSSAPPSGSLPPYVVVPTNFRKYYETVSSMLPPIAKIYDFGSAQQVGTTSAKADHESCVPEYLFASVVLGAQTLPMEPPRDVWMLGVTIFEVVSNTRLFNGSPFDMLIQIASLVGHIPEAWRPVLPETLTITRIDADALWVKHRDLLRRSCEDDEDVKKLEALLRRIFVIDPAARPTSAELLIDPWFTVP